MDAAMPKDAPPKGGAWPEAVPLGPRRKVSEMQAKLHRWAAAELTALVFYVTQEGDPGRV
ncbi:MAG: group intron reverse transcriptase/maturase [Nonomuraea muscovyensis]|nr:group intron reverse transcriptase/maturase [Nonomuraea muscovyensis]